MKNLNNYLNKKKTIKDQLGHNTAHRFCNLFKSNLESNLFLKKKILPYGWHWLYFPENFALENIGKDGHLKRGDFFPLFKGCKRMFAGSEIFFLKKALIDTIATKTSEISNIENKSINNKKLFFVNVKNTFKIKSKKVLIENQKIVFVDQNYKSKRKNIEKKSGYKVLSKKNFCFNNVILFRYSAITYNSHRIHYDLDYTKKQEGYKNLLVHGPLLASYVLNQLSLMKSLEIVSFEFRMLKPVIVNEKIKVNIFKSLVNINKFKVTIVSMHTNELKLIATCFSK